jgi:glycosyltransferase involved in cell wall biosynthesis
MVENDDSSLRTAKTTRHLRVGMAYPYWNFELPPKHLHLSLEILAVRLATDLAARGCDVTLYKRATSLRDKFRPADFRGVHFVQLRCPGQSWVQRQKMLMMKLRDRYRFNEVWRKSPLIITPLYDAEVAIDLWRHDLDIVHIFIHDGMVPLIRRLNRNIRIIVHVHDHSQCQRDHTDVTRTLDQADLIVGCSAFITQQLRATFPEIADRCIAIPNAINVEEFCRPRDSDPGKGPPRFLFVGRLSPEKGVHALVEAFNQINREIAEAELWLVGPDKIAPIAFVDPYGEDRLFDGVRSFYGIEANYAEHLQGLLTASARSKTRFCGNVPFRQIRRFYSEANVLVLPSLWPEPFGLPVIEGMAHKMPVIATQYGAFPDIVHDGQTGLLVERGSVAGLAAAMMRLAKEPRLRTAMGLAGRRRVEERFNWTDYVESWQTVYETLLQFPAPADASQHLGNLPLRPEG